MNIRLKGFIDLLNEFKYIFRMKSQEQNEFQKLILSTFSFFEPMTLEKVLLDLDISKLNDSSMSYQDLLSTISYLEKKKLIKVKGKAKGKDRTWIRVYPKRKFSFQNYFLSKFF